MLNEFITSETRRKLLTVFLTNPDSKFYLRELTRKIQEQPFAVQKELRKLAYIGFLKKEEVANLHYYYVNKKFVIFDELRNIILKTDPAMNLISSVLNYAKVKFRNALTSVILFGSIARNEIRKDSDVDLIIICKTLPDSWRQRDLIIVELEKQGFLFGRTVHIELATEKEIEFSVKNGAPLLFEVLKNHKVICDKGFFKKQMDIFKDNVEKWNARKIDKFTWEVPELAVKV